MTDPSHVFASFEEAIRETIAECGGQAEHLVVNPEDARGEGFKEEVDDATGALFFLVDGVRVYMSTDCPPGQIGACVPDPPIGQA